MMSEFQCSAVSPPRTVDIWLTKLSDITPSLHAKYCALLTTSEKKRLKRFHAEDNETRHQFLTARALCRTALSHYVAVPAVAWFFGVNKYGKPHVVEPKSARDLKFNISHTEGLVACAVSWDFDVGIDVENVRQMVDHKAVARAAFTPLEFSAMIDAPPTQQRQYFYSLWTLKEAYIKAQGMGLSRALNSFWFQLDHGAARIYFPQERSDVSEHWKFIRFDPTPEHKLALAARSPREQELIVNMRWIVPLA